MPNAREMTQAGAERRRTQRVSIPFRIEVCGREQSGNVFQIETTTIDVNEHGCKFGLKHQVGRGDLVTIRHVTPDPTPTTESIPTLFQIVWAQVHEAGWTVGAMKLRDATVWPMTFPAQLSIEHTSVS